MSETHYVVFGGPDAKFVRRYRDLIYSIEHVNGQESVCIWRANREPGNGAMVVGITVFGLYFDGKTGLPTAIGISRVKDAIKVLGFGALDPFATRHVLDCLYLAIDDVVKLEPLAPKPIDLSGVEGVTLRVNGDVVKKN